MKKVTHIARRAILILTTIMSGQALAVPTLSVHSGAPVQEGSYTYSYVEISEPASYNIYFTISTWKGVYYEANYRGEGGDYQGLVDSSFVIPAGMTNVNVPVLTYQNLDPLDWAEERFELRIDQGSVYGALVGVDRAPVTIINVLPPIIDVFGDDADEGTNARVRIRVTDPVGYDISFKVYTYFGNFQEANYRGTGGDYDGFTSKTVTIKANDDDEYVSVWINQNGDPVDWLYESFELCIDESTVIAGVLVGSPCGQIVIKDVAIPPPPTQPSLNLYEGGISNEGEVSLTLAELTSPTTQDVTFTVSTVPDYYNQANVLYEGGDYAELINQSFVIPAGQTLVDIPVTIYQNADPNDWLYEATRLCIDVGSVSGATLGTNCTVFTIMDVATWEIVPPATGGTPITAADLQPLANAIIDLENEMGTTAAANVISNHWNLSRLGRTIAQFPGLLSDSLLSAVVWFAGTTTYASELELQELVDRIIASSSSDPNQAINTVQNETGKAMRVMSISPFYNGPRYDLGKLYWTSNEMNYGWNSALRAGDYVDGRLVVHFPGVGFKKQSNGNVTYSEFVSLQGRYENQVADNYSHNGDFAQGFDAYPEPVGGTTYGSVYVVAPTDGYIVFAIDGFASDPKVSSNNGVGNVVTMRAKETDANGDPVFVSFFHLEKDSVPDYWVIPPVDDPESDTSHTVKAGQVIGVMGNTGGNYGRHIHVQASNEPTREIGKLIADGRTSVNSVPPVYMLLGDATIAERHELSSTLTEEDGLVQDYGFPIGDTDPVHLCYGTYSGDPCVATDILPSFATEEFFDVATDFSEQFGATNGDNVITVNTDDTAFKDGRRIGSRGFDSVTYVGSGATREQFTFIPQMDGTVTVTSAKLGTEVFQSIEGVWFGNETNADGGLGQWYEVGELTNENVGSIIEYWDDAVSGNFYGTTRNETFRGFAGSDYFTASDGDDVYDGGVDYDQVNYWGPSARRGFFTFTENADSSITVEHAYFGINFGTDTFISIEGVWFGGDGAWYAIDDLLE